MRPMEELGVDRAQLRRSLHNFSTRLAGEIVANGQGAPPCLSDVIRQSADEASPSLAYELVFGAVGCRTVP
jgi:hypothetical protein